MELLEFAKGLTPRPSWTPACAAMPDDATSQHHSQFLFEAHESVASTHRTLQPAGAETEAALRRAQSQSQSQYSSSRQFYCPH